MAPMHGKVKGQECPGSFKAADQPPAGSSASARPLLTAAPVINPHVATRGSSASVSESPSQVDFFHVFDRLTVVLRTAHLYDHVPKPCRDKVSKALSALLTAVCDDPCDAAHWCRLQCFFAFVLFKPTRGGRRTNQANYVIKRWISAVTTRIEQGSLSAAVRLACSPAGLAESSPETLAKLKAIHPSAPLNRRAFPAQEPSNGRVSPAQVSTALKSFNNGSSGGLDGLRPQHIKDLLSGPTPTDELLNNLTRFVNLLLSGVCPPAEPSGIAAHDGKRPDGCTLIPWRAGRCLVWDVTVPGTFAERYVQLTSKESGLAATRASDEKIKSTTELSPRWSFYRFVSRSSAAWTVTPPGFSIEFVKISVLGQAITILIHPTRSIHPFLYPTESFNRSKSNSNSDKHDSIMSQLKFDLQLGSSSTS
ncbi:hypothetical protein HELRODRAFT_164431 [Helobdella robusta]|uniref:Uncharacterized protein n=1 Tax=Helobdella robusta TaxID=6412 RepID=T1EVE9_HELRO|nr:hypothetical protein HELRODRAFT_164431 [Helobdella robusta]ESN94570.1 hypothetical protein HELRODRAFT_164431 [Helobdella robusta]